MTELVGICFFAASAVGGSDWITRPNLRLQGAKDEEPLIGITPATTQTGETSWMFPR